MKATILLTLTLAASPALAKDHSNEYLAGTFSSTGQLGDGSYAYCSGRSCSAYSAGHNIHYVRTDDGMFAIQAPISVGKTILLGTLTDGIAPQVHQQWFMDQLHEGDPVLFRAKCNKHNNCTIWVPNPDHDGKEYETLGYFSPDVAKTNTQTFCGKGKLKPEVEARVCGQVVALPPAHPAPAQPSPAAAQLSPTATPAQ